MSGKPFDAIADQAGLTVNESNELAIDSTIQRANSPIQIDGRDTAATVRDAYMRMLETASGNTVVGETYIEANRITFTNSSSASATLGVNAGGHLAWNGSTLALKSEIPSPDGTSITASNGVWSATFTESDPIFAASAAHSITAGDISAWDEKFNEADTASYISDTFGMSYTDNSYTNNSERVELEAGVSVYTVPDGIDQFSNSSDLTLWAHGEDDDPTISIVVHPADWTDDYFEGTYEGETWSIQLGGKDGPEVTIPATAFANEGIVDINFSQEVVDVSTTPLNDVFVSSNIARTSAIPTPDGTTITASNGVWSAVVPTFTESDPVFAASAAATITASDISAWNGKQDALTAGSNITISGNTISAAFTFTESDPVFAASAAASITASDISNWNALNGVPTATTVSDGYVLTTSSGSAVWAAPAGSANTLSAGAGIAITTSAGVDTISITDIRSEYIETDDFKDEYVYNAPTIRSFQ